MTNFMQNVKRNPVKYAAYSTWYEQQQAMRKTGFFDTAKECRRYCEINNVNYDIIRPVANWKEVLESPLYNS